MKSDIVLAGVGGQGILSIATILGVAALSKGLNIKQSEVHGMSQRGGEVQSHLRISSSHIASDLIPIAKADIIISLEPMEALRYLPSLSADGWLVSSTVPCINIGNYPEMDQIEKCLAEVGNVVSFDMDAIAKNAGSPRSNNMVLLGAASPFIDIEEDAIVEAIRRVFSHKGDSIVDANVRAFGMGRERTLALIEKKS